MKLKAGTVVSVMLPVIGLAFAIYWVLISPHRTLGAAPAAPPATSPYPTTIAAVGLIETGTRNMNLAPSLPGQVVAVYVKENDAVRKGAPLYQVDAREQQAALERAEAELERQQAAIATARSDVVAREASIASAVANIAAAQAAAEDAAQIRRRNEFLYARELIAAREVTTSVKTHEAAAARVAEAQAQGGQARAQLEAARARVREAQISVKVLEAQRQQLATALDKLTVLAPQDGRVLQVNVQVGEVVSSTPAVPPVLFGRTEYLQVRADVDEFNASRIEPGDPATAFLKGDAERRIPLEFVRIDPYIVPKRSLTGDNTERVDVRVLQLIYRFRSPAFPAYVGQQVDVFIDTSR